MIFICSLHTVCEICMALGGIGTLGTFIWMGIDSIKKRKQINIVQQIQSNQLEALYEPSLRILWSCLNSGNLTNEIVIENHGEDIVISDIDELTDTKILNKDGMKTWFPYNMDKNSEIHIPIKKQIENINECEIGIKCSNKLGLIYLIPIDMNNNKPVIKRPILQTK